ncbi:MAG: hypothetical protein ABMA01_18310 [Chthoniobacteraceae bacterium]
MDADGPRLDQLSKKLRLLGRQMTGRPLPSVLAAIASGFLAGLVLRLFETPGREK